MMRLIPHVDRLHTLKLNDPLSNRGGVIPTALEERSLSRGACSQSEHPENPDPRISGLSVRIEPQELGQITSDLRVWSLRPRIWWLWRFVVLAASIAKPEYPFCIVGIGSAFPITPPPPALLFWGSLEQRKTAEIRRMLPDSSFVQHARSVYPTNPGPSLSEKVPDVTSKHAVVMQIGAFVRAQTSSPGHVEDLLFDVSIRHEDVAHPAGNHKEHVFPAS